MPLSQLPAAMQANDIDPKKIFQNRKVLAVLDSEFKDDIRVIQNEQSPPVFGAIPSSVDAKKPYSNYFYNSEESTKRKYPNALWRAFTAPLDSGKRRYLTTAPLRYVDLLDSAAKPAGSYEINRERIIGDSAGSASLVGGSIDAWLKEVGETVASLKTKISGGTSTKLHADWKSFVHGLSSLSDDDARRISIPLDIVRKIIGQNL